MEKLSSKSKTGLTKTLKLAETCIENSLKHGGGGHYVIPLQPSMSLPPLARCEEADGHGTSCILLVKFHLYEQYRMH